jgi:hypothetical protein
VAEVVERDSGSGHRVSSGGQCFLFVFGRRAGRRRKGNRGVVGQNFQKSGAG